MNLFDARQKRFGWVSALPPYTSVRAEPGCVQCGSRLEPTGFKTFNFSGKCLNCSASVAEDDEVIEEL